MGVFARLRDRGRFGPNGGQVGGFLRRASTLDVAQWEALAEAAAMVRASPETRRAASGAIDLALRWVVDSEGTTLHLNEIVDTGSDEGIGPVLLAGMMDAESTAWRVWSGPSPPIPELESWDLRLRAGEGAGALTVAVVLLQLRRLTQPDEWAALWEPFGRVVGPAERL